jgi:PAS domain-containing protein
MCLLVWFNEILDLPHILMNAPRTPINWQESLVETVLIVILGLFVYSKTVHFVSQTSETEKILREKEERYHSTLDNMLEGCQIISTDWRYLYINDAGA